MRLAKIKLAGFKSFVDPTTIPFTSNLAAIVGPNGCGKSNVIDAVRWVMGESSAKHLRGGALTDVIFSGSTARQPVGQASVELIFDNSEGKLGGEFSQFSEIVIRRTVNRDAQSNYYLNGTKCRKKDITDVFLGTGLGPRSYAIVEQGMISRVIESKPEELRVFIEEAAGISKYKERRRETENRIGHTRDNLSRLNDLRQELEKQLNKLSRQAENAKRYQVLKQALKEMQVNETVLQWQHHQEKITEQAKHIASLEASLTGAQSDITHHQKGVEALRTQIQSEELGFEAAQKAFYEAGTEVARLEQSIQHHNERAKALHESIAAVTAELTTAEKSQSNDEARHADLVEQVGHKRPLLAQSEAELQEAQQAARKAEEAVERWRQTYEDWQRAIQSPQQAAEIARNSIQHLEQAQRQTESRRSHLQSQLQQLQVTLGQNEAPKLEAMLNEHAAALENLEAAVSQLTEVIEQKAKAIESEEHGYQELVRAEQQCAAELKGLETMQSASMASSRNADVLQSWLQSHQLAEAPLLVEHLTVAEGFEKAVEQVLAPWLNARVISGAFPNQLPEASVQLLKGSAPATPPRNLAASIQAGLTEGLAAILNQIHVADTYEAALALLDSIPANESVITRAGEWVSHHHLRKEAASHQDNSVLARKNQIAALKETHAELVASKDQAHSALVESKAALSQEKAKLRDQTVELKALRQTHAQAQQQFNKASMQQQTAKSRFDEYTAEANMLNQNLTDTQANIASARQDLAQSIELLSELEGKRSKHAEEKDAIFAAANQAKQVVRNTHQAIHGHMVALKALETELASLASQTERGRARVSQLKVSLDEKQAQVQTMSAPLEADKAALQQALELRHGTEGRFNEMRQLMTNLKAQLTELEAGLAEAQTKVSHHQSALTEAQVAIQADKVHQANANQQLQHWGIDPKVAHLNLPEHIDIKYCQQEIESIHRKIKALGAINEAAVEEFDAAQARKTYLDEQHADLSEALDSLEEAIRKIDKETRQRFKETFDFVNSEFKRLFPTLFEGGEAHLALTGDDLLETGVAVIARPPGKRNAVIQQLSGGEKALTAAALVFAIFQLNPAPFCMLDEVDAPLDDANVGRFCRLVKEMAKQVQFIYISHNKIAIEMANQLQGVTMREPGVSRIVSVDVAEAAALAEA